MQNVFPAPILPAAHSFFAAPQRAEDPMQFSFFSILFAGSRRFCSESERAISLISASGWSRSVTTVVIIFWFAAHTGCVEGRLRTAYAAGYSHDPLGSKAVIVLLSRTFESTISHDL